jgi:thiol-disulfide isomerase/thioredoxin
MSRRAVLLLALIAFVALQFMHYAWKPRPTPDDWRQFSGGSPQAREFMGRLAPLIEAETLDGEPFSLADHVGRKMIVINFFTTWCGPCRAEMPELIAFARKYSDTVLFLGVDVGEEENIVRGFVAQMGIPFPVIADRDHMISSFYSVGSFPTTVVVNLDGTIGLYEVGMIRNADAAFKPHLEANRFLAETGGAISREKYLEQLRHGSNSMTADPEKIAADGESTP